MKITAIHLGLLFALVATAYIPFGALASHQSSGLTIRVETAEDTYNTDDNIEIIISAKNNSSRAKTLRFNSGCQTAYLIVNERNRVIYDSLDDQICTQAQTSVTINGGQTKTWTMTHDPDDRQLEEGEYLIVGEVLGYGDDETDIVVEEDADDDETVEVLVPNGGEKWKLGKKKTISWDLPDWQTFAAQTVDIYLVDIDGDEYLIDERNYDTQYRWKVGYTEDGRVPKGKYKIMVCLDGSNICDSSDSYFRIVR